MNPPQDGVEGGVVDDEGQVVAVGAAVAGVDVVDGRVVVDVDDPEEARLPWRRDAEQLSQEFGACAGVSGRKNGVVEANFHWAAQRRREGGPPGLISPVSPFEGTAASKAAVT